MDDRRLQWNFAIALGVALALPAQAAECLREGALGTSRVMTVDAAATPRVGYPGFRKMLDLCDFEIVLTFDDGPVPATDEKILAALEMALNGVSTTAASTPFFRYRFCEMSQPSLDCLERRGIVVFGTDLAANDWVKMTPEDQLKRMIESVNKAGKGIFLLHDSEAQTASALPAFLRYLRDNRYRVVHVVAAAPDKPSADARQSEKREELQ